MMKNCKSIAVEHGKRAGKIKKPVYLAPKLVVHSGVDFIDKLGPAQACSPSPGF